MTNSGDCLFCKIVQNEIPANKVYEDNSVLAFHDIQPAAPVHILVIPKKHIAKMSDATAEDSQLMGYLLQKTTDIARDLQLENYRLVCNNGAGSGQSVFHIHYHLLAGRPFSWPPG